MLKIIRKKLLDSEDLNTLVEGRIFYAQAPYDTDLPRNWPQLILSAERLTDAIHGVAGSLQILILCSEETVSPELLESLTRRALEGVFFNAHEIFLLKWAKSEVFTTPASERLPLINGLEMAFEIREFPRAETSAPDAIQALNDFFAAECFIIGRTSFEDYFKPTRICPAIYFETNSTKMTTQTYSTTWLESVLKCHLFAPTVTARREWLTFLSNRLSICKRVPLRDGSPLRVLNVETDYSADELSGQIKITTAYGLPRGTRLTTPILQRDYDWILKER